MDSAERRKAWTRSLVGLILVASAGGACLFIYTLLVPKPFTTTATFLIAPDQPSFFDKADLDYERRNEIFRQTQLEQIKSEEVIQSALREPGIAALALLAPCEDKVQWLSENLHAELQEANVDEDKDGVTDEDSRILRIQLRGTDDQSDDLRTIMKAICASYMRNVVYKDQQRELEIRYSEDELLKQLHKKLVLIIDERNTMREASPEAVAELEVMEIEIEEMTAVFRHLIHKRELKELSGGIGHVRQLKTVPDSFEVQPDRNFSWPWRRDRRQ